MKSAWWPLSVLVLAIGCSPRPETLRVNRIVIDAPPRLDDATADRDAIRRALRQRLAEDSTVELVASRREATHFLRLRIHPVMTQVRRAKAKGGPASGAPAGEQGKAGGGEPSTPEDLVRPVEIAVVGPGPRLEVVGRGAPELPLIPSVVSAFDDGWRALDRMRVLAASRESAVVEALADGDPRVREFAMEQAGERKLTSAVQPLIASLTKESRPDLVLRAIGSLVAIGDEAAVTPLINLTRQKPAAFVTQIVFAVATIGGRTAEAFLVTLASGHPDPKVQKGAQDALEELEQSRKRGLHPPAKQP